MALDDVGVVSVAPCLLCSGWSVSELAARGGTHLGSHLVSLRLQSEQHTIRGRRWGLRRPPASVLTSQMERWEGISATAAAVGIALPRSGCCQCAARTVVEIMPPRAGCCVATRTVVGIGSFATPRQFRRCCHCASRT